MHDIFEPAEMARVTAPLERAWTLPPAAYTEPAVFAAEAARIFQREWQCVARADQVADPGDFRCVDLLDQPVVVVRGQDGRIRTFSRICLHRAMPVAEGSGNATRFVCPYHHWTYELDGRLRSAPMMEGAEGFAPSECRLPQLRTEVWQGFVFANLDPHCAPLAPRLAELDPLIGNYDFSALVTVDTLAFDSPWNWKILVENFMEAYHHVGIHRTTFEPTYPARDSFVEDNHGAPWALLHMPGRDPDDELLAGCVFPDLLFAATGGTVVWYELRPTAHDSMTLYIHALLRPEEAEELDAAGREMLKQTLSHVHTEDIAANRGPWQGLNAPLTAQGRLSPYEKAIWQFNQYWCARMWP